ncbi:hypothetical protein NPIL_197521 [Nephila pilipes]|uniref:Uncharacterized protein n=1 Tax=Nephila pilipes TaxID=299642 RepID=A0A8X6UKH9_NEPPI|nr:hypothetical protein NPIL_197521 [Nephila pilipes]
MTPRCLKCKSPHFTRDCDIKEKIKNIWHISCEAHGHMSSWTRYPSFPKPLKGTMQNKKFSCGKVDENILYAQAAISAPRPQMELQHQCISETSAQNEDRGEITKRPSSNQNLLGCDIL